MKHKYPLIATAIAAAFASTGAYAQLTPAGMAAAPSQLIIAGSSAAQPTILGIIENDSKICNGTFLLLTSAGDTNFSGVTCNVASTIGTINSGTQITVYYRSEGGSVVGALPVSSGKSVLRLDPTQCTGSAGAYVCAVTGTSTSNGPNDSWTGAVTEGPVDLGVTDVEPAQLTNLDYPNNYKSSVFGKASGAQLATLKTVPALQQVFGLAINTTGTGITENPINLSRETVANIFTGAIGDWSKVPDALTGQPVTTTSSTINLINREPGSGTRTASNIYFLEYQCGGTTGIAQAGPVFYATGDEMAAANTTPGSIAYASINNLPGFTTKYASLTTATINGVAPSTQAAAAGAYDFWFEATLVPSTQVVTTGNPGATALSNYLQANIATAATYSVNSDVNFIPGATNTPKVPLAATTSGTSTSYVNPYTRGGNSCNVPTDKL